MVGAAPGGAGDDLRAMEMLLRFRADPLVKTRDGETPRGVAVGDEVRGVLMAAEEAGLVARRRRTKAPPPEVPRNFTKNFALIVEVSPIVGDRSAPYTAGADTKAIIEGLAVAMTDPGAVECYGLDGVNAAAGARTDHRSRADGICGPICGPGSAAAAEEHHSGIHSRDLLRGARTLGAQHQPPEPQGVPRSPRRPSCCTSPCRSSRRRTSTGTTARPSGRCGCRTR